MHYRPILSVFAIFLGAAACGDGATKHAVPSPRSSLDVHLSGTHVLKFPLDPRFVEVRRDIIQGHSDGKGGCAVQISPDTTDHTKAGQVVERDQSTCQYVVSRGYYLTDSASSPPSGTIDTVKKSHDTQDRSENTQLINVHPLLTSRTVKYRVGYKRVVTYAYAIYNQVELTWSWNGTVVSNGSMLNILYHDVDWTNTGSSNLSIGIANEFYEAQGASTASNVSDGMGEWCDAPGTTTASLQATVYGGQTGLDSEIPYYSISGPCSVNYYESYEVVS